jgi:hypothetical protein
LRHGKVVYISELILHTLVSQQTSCPQKRSEFNSVPDSINFAIHDSRGDFCGTIVLDELFISSKSPDPDETANVEDRVHEFIAISEAKDFELNEFDS